MTKKIKKIKIISIGSNAIKTANYLKSFDLSYNHDTFSTHALALNAEELALSKADENHLIDSENITNGLLCLAQGKQHFDFILILLDASSINDITLSSQLTELLINSKQNVVNYIFLPPTTNQNNTLFNHLERIRQSNANIILLSNNDDHSKIEINNYNSLILEEALKGLFFPFLGQSEQSYNFAEVKAMFEYGKICIANSQVINAENNLDTAMNNLITQLNEACKAISCSNGMINISTNVEFTMQKYNLASDFLANKLPQSFDYSFDSTENTALTNQSIITVLYSTKFKSIKEYAEAILTN